MLGRESFGGLRKPIPDNPFRLRSISDANLDEAGLGDKKNDAARSPSIKSVRRATEEGLSAENDSDVPFFQNGDGTNSTSTPPSKALGDRPHPVHRHISDKYSGMSEEDKNIASQRRALPIWAVRHQLLEKVKANRVVIFVGETGSGKSTQLPQFLMASKKSFPGTIAVTQPRRVAAISLARRVSTEVGSVVGQTVGYSVRFDDCSSEQTRIKYLTDGMLLREMIGDPSLSRYSVIILDEAHERTLLTDMLMGFIKVLLEQRQDLRVVVMSATLNAQKFANFFSQAEVCFVEGRQFEVEILHTPVPQENYVDAMLRTIFQIHVRESDGDILAFLTGQDEIESLESLITDYSLNMPSNIPKILICPLFSGLSQESQMKVFQTTSKGFRKIILATNIAETSVTVPGVRYVVDCGLAKIKRYNATSGIESLQVQQISRSSAQQRAGRAGREAPGKCFRLYTESAFNKLPIDADPEIQRINLAQAMLVLKARGVKDVLNFHYVDRPSRESILRAMEHLFSLGALDTHGSLTKLGFTMSLLPLSPSLARAVVAANERGSLADVIDIAACLSSENIFVIPQDRRDDASEAHMKFHNITGDHMTFLQCLRQFLDVSSNGAESARDWCRRNYVSYRAIRNAKDVRKQLIEYCSNQKFNIDSDSVPDSETILKSFLAGFVGNAALLQSDGSYRTVVGHHVCIGASRRV